MALQYHDNQSFQLFFLWQYHEQKKTFKKLYEKKYNGGKRKPESTWIIEWNFNKKRSYQ